MPHATGDLDRVLGLLQAIFRECQQNLLESKDNKINQSYGSTTANF